MKRYAIAMLTIVSLLVASTASAQYIVIRTGENVDRVLGTQLIDGKLTFGLPSGEQITVPIQYVDLTLTRAVSNGNIPNSSTPPPGPLSDIAPIINRHCAEQWKTDFRMQTYCREQQTEAATAVAKRDMSSGDRRTIRMQCIGQWKDDFQMLNYCEQKQLEALRKLGR